MAYKLEHKSNTYLDILNRTFDKWSNSPPDIYLMSLEGHKIFTQRIILKFYSPWISDILDSSTEEEAGISLPAVTATIVSLMKVLTTGLVINSIKKDLVEVAELAKMLGITFDNWQIGSKKNKVRATSEVKEDNKKLVSPFKRPKLKNVKIERVSDPDGEDEKSALLAKLTPEIQMSTTSEEECNLCGSILRSKYQLQKHIKSHYIKHSQKCEDCGLFFKNKQLLGNHNLLLHDNLRGEEALLLEDTQEQIDLEVTGHDSVMMDETINTGSVDKGSKNIPCPSCDKRFSSTYHLKRHQDIHEGVKYGCRYCDLEFKRKDKVNHHMRSKHPEEVSAEISEDSPNSKIMGNNEEEEILQSETEKDKLLEADNEKITEEDEILETEKEKILEADNEKINEEDGELNEEIAIPDEDIDEYLEAALD